MLETKSLSPYGFTIRTLLSLDEKQLIELFQDLVNAANIKVVERIADCAFHFTENYEPQEEEKAAGELGEHEEYLEVDNLRRAREGV